MPQTGPLPGAAEDSYMSERPHEAESLVPTVGQERGSTRDEETKCHRRKQEGRNISSQQ